MYRIAHYPQQPILIVQSDAMTFQANFSKQSPFNFKKGYLN